MLCTSIFHTSMFVLHWYFDMFLFISNVIIKYVNGYITIIGEYILRNFCYHHIFVLGVFCAPLWPDSAKCPPTSWDSFSYGLLRTGLMGAIWRPGPCLNIKTIFPRYGVPMLKIRRLWDRLIFNMGISILVRLNLYIETGVNCATKYPPTNSSLY